MSSSVRNGVKDVIFLQIGVITVAIKLFGGPTTATVRTNKCLQNVDPYTQLCYSHWRLRCDQCGAGESMRGSQLRLFASSLWQKCVCVFFFFCQGSQWWPHQSGPNLNMFDMIQQRISCHSICSGAKTETEQHRRINMPIRATVKTPLLWVFCDLCLSNGIVSHISVFLPVLSYACHVWRPAEALLW